MKTLLLLIKHPATADNLLKYALEFATEMRMNMKVMYVEDPVQYPVGGPDLSGAALARLQEDLNERIRKGLKKLADQVAYLKTDEPGGQTVEVVADTGNDSKIINDLVHEGSIQMVMLRNMDHGFWFKDSRVRDIARTILCPVWVVPEDAVFRPFRKILYITDYSEEDIPTLKKLIDLMQGHEPEITALHVTENADFELRIKNAGFQKMLETKADYSRIKVQALVPRENENEMDLVNSYAGRVEADLMAVLLQNRSFLERLFGKDQAAKVVDKARSPVLLYHRD